jgi:hypothetical protein
VYATGTIFKEAETDYYIIRDFQIGGATSPPGRSAFSFIVVECGAPSDANPGWQLTFFSDKQSQFIKLFLRDELLSPSTILKSIETGVVEHPEIQEIKRNTVGPGTVLHINRFEVRCFPTSADARPATARLRLFDLSTKWIVKETFTGQWV